MLNVLLAIDDDGRGDAPQDGEARPDRAELAAAIDTAMARSGPANRRPKIRWLEAPPAADAPETPIDILLADPRTWAPLARQRAAHRVLLRTAGQAVAPPGAAGDALPEADDVLVWPSDPDELAVHCRRWLGCVRARRRIEQLEDQAVLLTRQNSSLRRQAARYLRQAQLRHRHDGDLRGIVARIDGISRLAEQLTSLRLEQVCQLCIERVPRLMGARLASLYLHDSSTGLLHLQRHNHDYPINAEVNLQTRPNCAMALAVARGELLLINEPDWARLTDRAVTRPYAHRYASGNCVISPLIAAGRVVGVLNLADRLDGLPFDRLVDLVPIRQLSEMLAASIRNIELFQTVQRQARTDGMTGLANHSTFVRELAREVARSQRYGQPLSLILVDVDSLKQINDELGHLAGDQALQLVARQIVQAIRDSDRAARYGGDEFAILLPSTALPSGWAVASRIVASISRVPVVHQGVSAEVTVSVGVGQYDGRSSPDGLLEQTDAALYRAKREGKNRIAVTA